MGVKTNRTLSYAEIVAYITTRNLKREDMYFDGMNNTGVFKYKLHMRERLAYYYQGVENL